ncbi:Uridine-cytidine kinase C-like protein [Drosera capensis]
MDDEMVQRVFEGGGRDYYQQPPSTSSSSSSILQSLPLHVAFGTGYYLLVKSIQELREKKQGLVTVGIGGPSGSGKTSLAEKVASVIGCTVISMENYRCGVEDSSGPDSIDFDALVGNLEVLFFFIFSVSRICSKVEIPSCRFLIFKRHVSAKLLKSASSGVVIVDGTYALHARLRSLLDIRVAVVGGVHFSLLSKVQYDIGDSRSLDNLIDSIFPLFRKHIEPDLHHAQIRINNSFSSSFREPIYKLKCKSESADWNSTSLFEGQDVLRDNFIEMYLRPPSASEEARINDWIKVGRMTPGGLLALGYTVVVSYKRASVYFSIGKVSLSLETIDSLGETFMVLRGMDRKTVEAEALRMGILGPWITKSYLELILEQKGVPRLNTPPPLANVSSPSTQERVISAPRPIRVTPNIVGRLEDLSQPWTRSPTKSKAEPISATWHFISDPSGVDSTDIDPASFRDTMQLAAMPDSYDFDRGLLLAVQGIQALLENKGFPININDVRKNRRTEVPVFDLETSARSGFKELEVSEDCGVVIFEGVYALHPDIRVSLDLWIAVVGGVHSHLISRVQRDKNRVGFFMSQNEIMTTVFPMFQQHIEPHLVHAHLKIRNDFDPVLSPESSLFVLKSNKQVAHQDIIRILDSSKFFSSVQNFIDIYLKLPGLPASGNLTEGDCIRVRICEGRFALLIREPIREGSFIIQPKVDFDISITTVAGLLNLGYQAVAYIEASAFIYQDGKILVEVDHLQDVPTPYIQIKGVDKEAVIAAGSMLKLDGSYTTKSYLQIILERLPILERSSSGIHAHQAARLQELVEYIQSQGSSSTSESSQGREVSPLEGVIDDLQCRVKRLERWQTINTKASIVTGFFTLQCLVFIRGPGSQAASK